MSVKMYLSWRTKQRKFSPLGAKHHFLLLFCPPVRLHLHKREMGLLLSRTSEEFNQRNLCAKKLFASHQTRHIDPRFWTEKLMFSLPTLFLYFLYLSENVRRIQLLH